MKRRFVICLLLILFIFTLFILIKEKSLKMSTNTSPEGYKYDIVK